MFHLTIVCQRSVFKSFVFFLYNFVYNILVIFGYFQCGVGLGTSTYCKPTGLNSLGLVCPEIRVH